MSSVFWKRRKNYFVLFMLTTLFAILVLIALLKAAVMIDNMRSELKNPPSEQVAEAAPATEPTVIPDDELSHPSDSAIPYTESDVELLAKIMTAEKGPNWPTWATMAIGEVVLNRVLSTEFPNTIEEVIYQSNPIQYEPAHSSWWDSIVVSPDTKDAARRLLCGERIIGDPAVVFQALFEQGSKTILSYYDPDCDSTTYWCTSYKPELYI